MECSLGRISPEEGPSAGEDDLAQGLDDLFYEHAKYLTSSLFVRWMVAEGKRSNLGGETSKTFFQHPAIMRLMEFVTPKVLLSQRYHYKLAAHAELLTEADPAKYAASVAAMVILLAEVAPFSLVLSLSENTRALASTWVEVHCTSGSGS